MCDYTQVEYGCGHLRYIVRAWCVKYQETHKRCPPNVVAVEYRTDENCGDCKNTSTTKHQAKKSTTDAEKKDNTPASSSAQSSSSSSKSS